MRRAHQYSIVDHELLHGGYLTHLSLGGMALYLFLTVVGDKNGMSYYSLKTISCFLKLQNETFVKDYLEELIKLKLVRYQKPNFWVAELTDKDGFPFRKIMYDETFQVTEVLDRVQESKALLSLLASLSSRKQLR